MTSIVLLHTTEVVGPGVLDSLASSMPKNGSEPHALWSGDEGGDEGREIVLHQPDESAKALRNLKGGVETNRREQDQQQGTDVYQIEVIHRSDIERSAEWYDKLNRYLVRKCAELGVPYVFPYPRFATDYGMAQVRYNDGGTRLNDQQWNDLYLHGVLGHCHAPENDHWDPTFSVTELIHRSNQSQEDDMNVNDFFNMIGGEPAGYRITDGRIEGQLTVGINQDGSFVWDWFPLGAIWRFVHQEQAAWRLQGRTVSAPASVGTHDTLDPATLQAAVVQALTNHPLIPKQ